MKLTKVGSGITVGRSEKEKIHVVCQSCLFQTCEYIKTSNDYEGVLKCSWFNQEVLQNFGKWIGSRTFQQLHRYTGHKMGDHLSIVIK